jgi:hypothetical protein
MDRELFICLGLDAELPGHEVSKKIEQEVGSFEGLGVLGELETVAAAKNLSYEGWCSCGGRTAINLGRFHAFMPFVQFQFQPKVYSWKADVPAVGHVINTTAN